MLNSKWDKESCLSRGDKILLIFLVILLFYVLWFCFGAATQTKSQTLIGPCVRAEIEQLLDSRGLPRNTTVEITERGYRAEFKGGWIRL